MTLVQCQVNVESRISVYQKKRICFFSSEKHILELLGLFGSFEELSMLPTSQGRFVQIYRDFINIESEISQILMKCFEIWKENCEGEFVGFSQDGAGGFFPEIMTELFSTPVHLKLKAGHEKSDQIDWVEVTCRDLCFCHGSLEEEDLLHFAPPRTADHQNYCQHFDQRWCCQINPKTNRAWRLLIQTPTFWTSYM